MGIVVEAAGLRHRRLEHVLAGMAEGRMADIVGEAERLGQILVEAERARHRPADLRDLEAVGEPDPEMVAVGRDEDLGLVPEAPERDRMDDPVAVALEGVARAALARSSSACRRPLLRLGSAARWASGGALVLLGSTASGASVIGCLDPLYFLARLACPGKCRDVGSAELGDELLRRRAPVSNGPTSRRLEERPNGAE